jgi:hypothetical protein
MKIDIFSAPPALSFGQGANAFKLRLKRFTDGERMRIIDACAEMNFRKMQEAVDDIVIGWEGVTDPEGIPLMFESIGEGRQVVKNLAAFLGAVDVALQIEVLAGILDFVGVPRKASDPLIKTFGVERPNTDPTASKGNATPGTASTK